jgi:hypothetical protein
VSLYAFLDNARRVLRNDPPFGPVRVRHLRVLGGGVGENDVLMLAADVSAHVGLTVLELTGLRLHTPAALGAVVDAALARRVSCLNLDFCRLSPASAPALARLLDDGSLTALRVNDHEVRWQDDPALSVLCDASRASSTLTSLFLLCLYCEPTAAAALLGALTGHRSLHTLRLRGTRLLGAAAALGELVAANAPSLVDLDVSCCRLHDMGLGPLFDALPHNTHLRTLNCCGNQASEAFTRDRLLPAVRANRSLRSLRIDNFAGEGEVAALMASRAAGTQ